MSPCVPFMLQAPARCIAYTLDVNVSPRLIPSVVFHSAALCASRTSFRILLIIRGVNSHPESSHVAVRFD